MYYKNVWSELTEKLKIRNTPGNRVYTYVQINRNKQLTNKQNSHYQNHTLKI